MKITIYYLLRYHPDVNQDVDATDVFAKINNGTKLILYYFNNSIK